MQGGAGAWEERFSQSKGRSYWWNRETGESRWELPNEEKTKASPQSSSNGGGIWLKHILIKHSQSRRPSSRLSAKITRSLEEARSTIQSLRHQISAGEVSFEAVAQEWSDCSSGTRGGDLGLVKRGEMMPAFEVAAFALSEGEISQSVETDSGVHLIMRYSK